MGEFELWLFRGVGAVVLIIVGDYLKLRFSMSEKYILKNDCILAQDRNRNDLQSVMQSNKEDHRRIEGKIDSLMSQMFEVVKGINKINGKD